MDAHLQEWLGLLLRWGHFITGVAWIGASFYFNWLENHLQRNSGGDGVAGDLWAIHGGGFYYLKKFSVAPQRMPANLHWFKWEAYATWLTGFALLCAIYYWNADTYLVDRSVADISSMLAIVTGLAALALSWLVYDLACRSGMARHNALLGLLILVWFTGLAWGLGQLFSSRAAFIHVGAAIGTIMVANVFRVIIPAQRDLVEALSAQRIPDASRGEQALQRSRHNNYFTLPVLFIMISGHFPGTYGHDRAWLVLLVISVAGVLVRHWFNQRHLPGFRLWPLASGILLLAGLVFLTAPRPVSAPALSTGPVASITEAWEVVRQRCSGCHAKQPTEPGFSAAPLGIELDTLDGLRLNAERVYFATVINRTMPLGNLTQITEAERHTIAHWFENSPYNPQD
jgi:uncharacterized membrane protein